ncbi:MAG TPA: GDP-L-fucose synthase [Candidatus Dormibacteraeota bacterium]|nr:GDP-L-fucose synthase [Candidatus Dormibacteraeota bacterium]
MAVELASARICVTGGAGFLGSYVVEELRRKGAQHVFVPRRADFDLTMESGVERMYREARPQLVIHLAGVVGGIGANSKRPGSFFYENAMMGIQVIEHARRNGVEKIVVVGTICAYPKHAPVPFREESLWCGYPEETNAPYGIAKKALLVQCQAYREQYGLNAIYLLPVNLYGPGDNFDPRSSHVIPALIRKCIEARESGAREIVVWGDGSPTREFLYVEDAARGIVLAAARYDGAEPINLGSGTEISIGDLAKLIAELCDFDGAILWDRAKPNGQPRRRLDVSRARQHFGFEPTVGLVDGLRRTIDWYQSTHRAPSQAPREIRRPPRPSLS